MTDDKFDELVDEWHESESKLPLHEYMGMTWEQYCEFIGTRFTNMLMENK